MKDVYRYTRVVEARWESFVVVPGLCSEQPTAKFLASESYREHTRKF